MLKRPANTTPIRAKGINCDNELYALSDPILFF